jgi:SAM-dependent methyltransferase
VKAVISMDNPIVRPSADADFPPKLKAGMGPTTRYSRWKKALKAAARYTRKSLGRILPIPAKHRARYALSIINAVRARVRVAVGVQPLSTPGYWHRGMPISRYYLEQFLQERSSDIFGHCLEFLDDDYTSRFGEERVTRVDILHKEAGNKKATIVADLTQPNDIPSDLFDCINCTYVLHMIFEVDKAVSELHRILKPGGVLLVAVPGFNLTSGGAHPLWLFTPEALHRVLARVFGAENVSVHAYGNSLTAAGYLRGLVAHEFTQAELNHHTPEFALAVFARAYKQG